MDGHIAKISHREIYEARYTTVRTRLGYEAKLFDEGGEFLNTVKLADDTGGVHLLKFDNVCIAEAELHEYIKSFYVYLIQRYLPGSIFIFHKSLLVFIGSIDSGSSVDDAFEVLISSQSVKDGVNIAKKFIQFLILNEYGGLSLEKAEEIMKLEGYSDSKNAYLSLFTLDEEMGPFSREELRVLNDASKNENIPVTDRLILALCLNYGLRPIQISLLKQADFVDDKQTGVRYLNVPRVKQGAELRRQEFSKRAVNDEVANLIREVIESNQTIYAEFNAKDPPLIFRKKSDRNFHVYNISHEELWEEPSKTHFCHHVGPKSISGRLVSIEKFLPLSPRTGKTFHIYPYRFRYTLGTNAVIEGMSEEEVADLLDHSSTLCVKHYFRYTKEMWEILENSTARRTEQKHFTAAWSRASDLSGNIYGNEVIELHAFTAIGKCQKESACYLEPAVACYSCQRFCPNKDASAHENALISLRERQRVVAELSTTTVSRQLDEAIAGCMAAVAYSNGEDVADIHEEGL